MALKSNGMVVEWGTNDFGQTNVPPGMSNVLAIAAGSSHSLALINNGTLVAWGDNSDGQTNIPYFSTNVDVKLITAGGDHSLAAIFSPWVQYPVDVSKDLLLIYNTNSTDSSNVCAYYLANRPMASNANVLGIHCLTNEQVDYSEYSTNIAPQIQNWLATNPTKRPAYVILFQDIPSRPDLDVGAPSVQVLLNTTCSPNWNPFVTSINMNGVGGTNDCIAYINKLALIGSIGSNSGQLIISASAGGYGNTNWYFDDAQATYNEPLGQDALESVESDGVPSSAVTYTPITNTTHITLATNVAGYLTWGYNGGLPDTYAIDGTISFFGASTWYLIETIESYNGQRNGGGFEGNFLDWYASNAFGGTNYSNTPVGAISTVEEPLLGGNGDPGLYFGLWVTGNNFGICAWNSRTSPYMQAVGDPLLRK